MEKNTHNIQNLKEPYPMNLLLTLNETILTNKPIPIEEVTQDNIEGLYYALTTLPERLREIVRLRFEERQTYSQIGVIMGVTPERIRYLIYDATKKLRQPPALFYIRYGKQGYEDRCARIAEEKKKNIPTAMELKIAELDLSVRSENRLVAKGCKTVADMVALSENEILDIKHLGKESRQEIAEKLESLGITDSAWSRI